MSSVNAYRGRLYLLGRLPHKDGSPGLKQQRITLKLDDTPANQKIAAKQLVILERQLSSGTFEWSYWTGEDTKGTTWREAAALLYRKKVVHGRTSENTWNVSYMGLLKQLPQHETVTTTAIEKALSRYERSQYSYKLIYYLMKDLAALTGVRFPEVGVPLYGKAKLLEVPSDEEVIAWVQGAKLPHRWFFGMMATYGLRPHEIEVSLLIDGDRLQVPDETKTGFRTVIPLYPEWVDLFDLRNPQQRPASIRVEPRPDEASQWLYRAAKKQGISYRPYALRHAYAARLWRAGGSELDIFTAARLMGHSIEQHVQTYRAHIDPNRIAVAAEDAIARNLAKVRQSLEHAAVQDPAPPH